jgi:tartrate-resistant acid phosphatase type 5
LVADASACSKSALVVGLVLFLVGTAALLAVLLTSVAQGSRGNDTVVFYVVGDWGRQGTVNQTGVSELMGRVGSSSRPAFIVSTGDNFYPNGLNSSSDELFDLSFKNVYVSDALQVPWYAVLGNHDYGDGFATFCENDESKTDCVRSPRYQLGLELASRDPRWFCSRTYLNSIGDGLVDIFFIDTSPMITSYHTTEWARYQGGIKEQSWQSQLKELESSLKSSNAIWKIVVGHHPPRSNGHHGNNTDLIENVEPLLSTYKVDAYFSGHDHDLEHLEFDDISTQYFVSGGGSDCDRGFVGNQGSKFQYPYSGFTAVRVGVDDMTIDFYTLEHGHETPLYSTTLRIQ